LATDISKRRAAEAALELVEPGMILGLGTGSTAAIFVSLLAARFKAGLSITCASTSEATERQARLLGLPVCDPDDLPGIDLTVDGADEFDPALNLIKGGGAALLREKIIAEASSRMVVIADASKEVGVLGRFPLPLEINAFAAGLTRRRVHARLAGLGLGEASSSWRMATSDSLLRTDGGHLILDLACGAISAPGALAAALDVIPGVVEHGLFIGYADEIIVGDPDGVRHLRTR
jgi:ribose 5-phosphate isomerase A